MKVKSTDWKQLFSSAWDQLLEKKQRIGIPLLRSVLPEGFPSGCLVLIQFELPKEINKSIVAHLLTTFLKETTYDIVFVDGGNVFPYEYIIEAAKKMRLMPKMLLNRIILARAFNLSLIHI
mgnify:CR=1 FL=1